MSREKRIVRLAEEYTNEGDAVGCKCNLYDELEAACSEPAESESVVDKKDRKDRIVAAVDELEEYWRGFPMDRHHSYLRKVLEAARSIESLPCKPLLSDEKIDSIYDRLCRGQLENAREISASTLEALAKEFCDSMVSHVTNVSTESVYGMLLDKAKKERSR